jgi:hypothetical protein
VVDLKKTFRKDGGPGFDRPISHARQNDPRGSHLSKIKGTSCQPNSATFTASHPTG